MTELPPITAGERLAHEIRGQIQSGELAHGALLPATQALAREFNVSASTVSKAVNQLKAEGLIVTAHRSARAVNNPPASPGRHGPARAVTVLVAGVSSSQVAIFATALARRTHWALLNFETLSAPIIEAAHEQPGNLGIGMESKNRGAAESLSAVAADALIQAAVENVECETSSIIALPAAEGDTLSGWCKKVSDSIAAAGGNARFVDVRESSEDRDGWTVHALSDDARGESLSVVSVNPAALAETRLDELVAALRG